MKQNKCKTAIIEIETDMTNVALRNFLRAVITRESPLGTVVRSVYVKTDQPVRAAKPRKKGAR